VPIQLTRTNGSQFSFLDWILVLAAHGPHLEVFRLINVVCGHMLDSSVLTLVVVIISVLNQVDGQSRF